MADIGALTFKIGADITDLATNMRKAQGAVETAMAGASRAAMAAKAALGSIAVGALLVSQAQNVRRLIDEADQLDDVAQKTGAAVEELSRLQQVARVNGTQFTEVEGALVKFTKALNTIGEESGDASRAMKAIGLNIDDFKGKDPAAAFIATAKALNGYEDSAGKTALALALFGKSGAQMLPMLKDTAQFHDITSKVTAQQAAEAANLNDEIRRLNLVMDQSKQVFLMGAVPALNEWVEAVRVAYQEGGKLAAVITAIGGAMTVPLDIFAGGDRGRLKSLQTEIDRERKILADMGDPNQTYRYRGAQANARNKQQERVNALLREEFALANKIAFADEAAAAAARANKGKKLDFALGEKKPGGAGKESPFDQEIKRLEEAKNKALELTEVERILVEIQQNKYGIITDGQKNLLLAAAAQVDLNKEDTKTRKEAEEALKKSIADRDERTRKEAETVEQLRESYASLNVSILELSGDGLAAAIARFDQQHKKMLESMGEFADRVPGGEAAIARLRELTLAQEQFNASRDKFEMINAQLQVSETRIQNALKVGAISELDALQKTGDARRLAVDVLQRHADEMRRFAQESNNPKLLQQAEELRVRMESLRTETDLVGEKFNTIFKDAASSGMDEFRASLQRGEGALQSFGNAFKRFALGVTDEISKIAQRNLAQALFGGTSAGGVAGGVGGWLAGKLFGAGGSAGFTNNSGSAAGFGDFAGIGGNFVSGGSFAEGGRPPVGLPSLVGERGPELFVPDVAGTVIPNKDLRRMGGAAPSITIVQNMSFGSDVDRTTLTAWGKEIKRNTIATVADLARRGGNFSAALG